MTPSEAMRVEAYIRVCWPGSKRWSDEEWKVLRTGMSRVDVEYDQAEAALRNHKLTSDKFPTVAAFIRCVKGAEQKRAVGASPANPNYHPPEIEYDEHGRTSFERRVIDDPKFREFARRNGRLPVERERAILAGERNTAGMVNRPQEAQ